MHRKATVLLAAGALALAAATGASASALITSAQIKDGTIQSRDLSPALRHQLAAKTAPGPAGAQGPKGDAGKDGLPGAPGGFDPTKIVYVTGTPVALPAQFGVTFVNADCPAGARVLGGGFTISQKDGGVGTGDVSWSKPNGDSGWTTGLRNTTTADETGAAYAICATQ